MKASKKQAVAYVKGSIAPSQIKAIHATVHKLGLDDDAYRNILETRYGVDSCKRLTWRQAEELLAGLNGNNSPQPPLTSRGGAGNPPPLDKGGLRGVKGYRPLKYQDMDHRPGFASGAQLRLVDAMWHQVTRAEGDEAQEKALDSFCRKIAGVAGLRMVKAWQVEKIVKAMEAMGAEKKP